MVLNKLELLLYVAGCELLGLKRGAVHRTWVVTKVETIRSWMSPSGIQLMRVQPYPPFSTVSGRSVLPHAFFRILMLYTGWIRYGNYGNVNSQNPKYRL